MGKLCASNDYRVTEGGEDAAACDKTLPLPFAHDYGVPSGLEPPHCQGFTITLRHTTLSTNTPDE